MAMESFGTVTVAAVASAGGVVQLRAPAAIPRTVATHRDQGRDEVQIYRVLTVESGRCHVVIGPFIADSSGLRSGPVPIDV
jgi:hypothetical protein